jgi:cardiolipin synthase
MKDKAQKPIKTKRNPEKRAQPRPKETLFFSGDSHFESMIDAINHAKQSIHLETYIFQKDAIGTRIIDALSNAARRGVDVKILVDGAGGPLLTTSYAANIEKAGGEVRIYHPFWWQIWNYSRSYIKLPFLLKWIYLFIKSNKRNHRKTCLIDNNIAYIGSMNISEDHISKEHGGNGWRDTSIRLEGTNFDTMNKAFYSAWSHRTIKERLKDTFRYIRREPIFRFNYTWLRRRILYKSLLRKIRLCKDRIWITNAYFVPDNFLLRRLKEAAHNGVDVRILLPKKSDVFMMPWASSTFYYSLLKAGVRIFEYLPSNLHAKTLIFDNWMLIGSSNLNYRSLLHDLEIDVNVRRQETKEKLVAGFLDDLKNSKEISMQDLGAHRPWIQRFLGRIVLYMKYWI